MFRFLSLFLPLALAAGEPIQARHVISEVGKPADVLDLEAEGRRQYADVLHEFSRRDWYQKVAAQAYDRQALILPEDRDPVDVILRRIQALLAEVQALGPRKDLRESAERLTVLAKTAAQIAPEMPVKLAVIGKKTLPPQGKPTVGNDEIAPVETDSVVRSDAVTQQPGARERLFLDLCRIRREILFAHPRVDFDRLLFITRANPYIGHMCDQYYGWNAAPGGRLLVLEDPFSNTPRRRDLLEGIPVAAGAMAGKPLSGGAVLSPEVSYDGKTVFFAYNACIKSSPNGTFWHLFRMSVDGRDLRQLTDGPVNDFDPCSLPDGRLAFISERRGGYLRCSPGRKCPTFTLHRMAADGSAITCLSFHETNEWHPSVNRQGKLVYTRWDYVDRGTNVAHHLWECFPDGRDPRSLHGNYPLSQGGRPWGEWHLRAMPDREHLYVGTAAAHHGPAFGSLVTIDLAQEDDNRMSQVRRVTPEAAFPETGEDLVKYPRHFGGAWPLNARLFLVPFDAAGKQHRLYLLDALGNRELLYEDPRLPCLSPIPLRSRPVPTIIPDQTVRDGSTAQATVTVLNAYDSDFPWPSGSRIAGLRIIQLLPKTTPQRDNPRIGVASGANARAVLGTVPVESDGSAHFLAPAGKALYFQALDERGLAIQSMRSATYLQPGERLSCQGCHESKRQAPRNRSGPPPVALSRPPSVITPEPEGSKPFSYVRLVQPVLDKHCVTCHQQRKGPDLSGALTSPTFSASYLTLTGKTTKVSKGKRMVKYDSSGSSGNPRSVAGALGARGSGLFMLLEAGHQKVQLPPEDFRRITLWLDCNSDFYGSYDKIEEQRQGKIVIPELE